MNILIKIILFLSLYISLYSNDKHSNLLNIETKIFNTYNNSELSDIEDDLNTLSFDENENHIFINFLLFKIYYKKIDNIFDLNINEFHSNIKKLYQLANQTLNLALEDEKKRSLGLIALSYYYLKLNEEKKVFENIENIVNKSWRYYFFMSQFYYDQDNLSKSYEYIKIALYKKETNLTIVLNFLVKIIENQDGNLNIKELEDLKLKFPNYLDIFDLSFGKYFLSINNYEKALKYFKNVLKIDDKNIIANYYLGVLMYSYKGEYALSKLSFLKILNQKYLDYNLSFLIKSHLSNVFIKLGQKKTAAIYFINSLDNEGMFYNNINILYSFYIENKFNDDLLKNINTIIDKYPEYEILYKLKANILENKGEYKKALKEYNKSFIINPDIYTFYKISFMYFKLKEVDKSTEILKKIINTNPGLLKTAIEEFGVKFLKKFNIF